MPSSAATHRAADARTGSGDDLHRSMIYSGVVGLGLAVIGMAIVTWRRRFW